MSSYILIVDDNDSGRYLKSRILRRAGFVVGAAASAAEALEHMDKHAVHVAVLDVKLPDLHGFELCRLIKTRFPSVAVLQTSATFTTAEDRVAGLDVGADAYLVEPMEETELVATVSALLRVRQAEAALRATEARFAQFAQANPDVLWIYDVDRRRFDYISPSFEELFGFSPKDVQQNPDRWFASVSAEHRDAFAHMVEHGPAPIGGSIEYRILRSDGTYRWIRDRAFLLPGEEAGHGSRVAGLARDISEYKRSEEQRELLIRELNHRVKNTLAIVQALAGQTLRASTSHAEFEEAFTSRLHALAHAHDLLTEASWEGTTLKRVIDAARIPFANHGTRNQITVHGPDVWLDANLAVTLTMTFHELATNSTKYGALSVASGRVVVTWTAEPAVEPKEIHLHWVERGGPPVSPPSRKGFGSTLVEKVLVHETQGGAEFLFHERGLEFRFRLPLTDRAKLA